jgi:hypothetical protein
LQGQQQQQRRGAPHTTPVSIRLEVKHAVVWLAVCILLLCSPADLLLLQVFNAISDELRAKDNAEFAKSGNRK